MTRLAKLDIWRQRVVRSKTLWFNAIVAALIALEASFSLLQPLIKTDFYVLTSVFLAIGNAVLRTITSTALKDK